MLLASALVAAVVLTRSRNAIAALPLALPWVLGPMQWWWLLPLLILAAMPLALAVLPGVPDAVQQWVRGQLPSGLRQRFVEGQSTDSLTRVAQWRFGVELIAQRPWLGWGAAAFSVLYQFMLKGNGMAIPTTCPWNWRSAMDFPWQCSWWVVLVLIVVALQRGMLCRGPMERAGGQLFGSGGDARHRSAFLRQSDEHLAGCCCPACTVSSGSTVIFRQRQIVMLPKTFRGECTSRCVQGNVRDASQFISITFRQGGGGSDTWPGMGSSSPLSAARYVFPTPCFRGPCQRLRSPVPGDGRCGRAGPESRSSHSSPDEFDALRFQPFGQALEALLRFRSDPPLLEGGLGFGYKVLTPG